MATYFINGTGNSLLDAYNAGATLGTTAQLADHLLYVKKTEFGIANSDGSFTYVNGSGFTFDKTTGEFTAGTVSAIRHYDAAGAYIDDIRDFATPLAVTELQSVLEGLSGGDSSALADLLFSGNDHLNANYFTGTDGGVTLNGLAGSDVIYGSKQADTLFGGLGKDRIDAGRGADVIYGGNGADKLYGGSGSDRIYGDASGVAPESGRDRINGGTGDDYIDGGRADDVIMGGEGNDTILGGISGDDKLTGGTGADLFIFSFSGDGIRPVGGEYGNDIIIDFEVGVDSLILSDMLSRPVTLGNNADGNAVIFVDAHNSVTLAGIDANTISLNDLMLI